LKIDRRKLSHTHARERTNERKQNKGSRTSPPTNPELQILLKDSFSTFPPKKEEEEEEEEEEARKN